MDLGISGLASGFDWKTLVDQLADVERAPQKRLRNDQAKLGERNNAYGSIFTQLSVLKNRVDALKAPTLFEGRLGKTSDATIATASASAGSAVGSYVFNITQLATTSVQRGGVNAGRALNSSNDVSGLVLSSAPFRSAVTAGTFTVNGKQVTLATSDTLGAVFDKIATATGGMVTAGYDPGTDLITLSSSGTIVLGSGADTSNFLQVAKLENNGTNEISSAVALGTVQQNTKLNVANLATALSDGGSGAGQFKINGVSISFSASTDTMADVLARINNSTAGVVATYDAVNDRFQLTNKATGDVGVAMQDVTGNFLAATQLSSGTLSRGKNLLYTINGGGTLTSHSNSIGQDSSSISGLTVTALKEGSVTIETTSDTARIKAAINDFLAEYNKSQSLISSQTASTTDAKGKVTAGVLAADSDANELATRLRRMANGAASGLAGTFSQLAQLGINSNGTDDTITLTDSAKLDDALAGHLGELKDLFSNATGGLAVKLSSFLNGAVGDGGSVVTKQANLLKQSASIDAQVVDLERIVQANRSKMVAGFLSMEQAQSNINQQLKYLSQRFGT